MTQEGCCCTTWPQKLQYMLACACCFTSLLVPKHPTPCSAKKVLRVWSFVMHFGAQGRYRKDSKQLLAQSGQLNAPRSRRKSRTPAAALLLVWWHPQPLSPVAKKSSLQVKVDVTPSAYPSVAFQTQALLRVHPNTSWPSVTATSRVMQPQLWPSYGLLSLRFCSV